LWLGFLFEWEAPTSDKAWRCSRGAQRSEINPKGFMKFALRQVKYGSRVKFVLWQGAFFGARIVEKIEFIIVKKSLKSD